MEHTWFRPAIVGFFVAVLLSIVAYGGIQAYAQDKQDDLRTWQPGEIVILDIPAGVGMKVAGNSIEWRDGDRAKGAYEARIIGGATLTWGNGFRLRVRDTPVVMLRGRRDGPIRIFVQSNAGVPK